MKLSAKMRYMLVTLGITVAGAIQLVRGYPKTIVIVGGFAFLTMGNLVVYLSGAKERAIRKQRKRDFYAGKI